MPQSDAPLCIALHAAGQALAALLCSIRRAADLLDGPRWTNIVHKWCSGDRMVIMVDHMVIIWRSYGDHMVIMWARRLSQPHARRCGVESRQLLRRSSL